MKANFIGFESVNYTNKSGVPISGVRGYYAVPIKEDRGVGHCVRDVFFHPERFGLPALPQTGVYDLEFGCTSGGKAYLESIKHA